MDAPLPLSGHDPVLLREVLELLQPAAGKVFVDCTTGRGGHALELARRLRPGAGGQLLCLDADPRNLQFAKDRLEQFTRAEGSAAHSSLSSVLGGESRGEGVAGDVGSFSNREEPLTPCPSPLSTGARGADTLCRVRFFHANFAELGEVLREAGIEAVDGILADLGISTNQLFDPAYGLSFSADGPLDMRVDATSGRSAADLVNHLPEEELANVLYNLAQERYSRRIARKITEARRTSPILTTGRLADIVRSAIPHRGGAPEKIDPATRTFLALRMAVNQELENLGALLKQAPRLLKSGGRFAVISFQSMEDRLVKQAFRALEMTQPDAYKTLTPKPLSPTAEELAVNPRSRSAKLRAIRRK